MKKLTLNQRLIRLNMFNSLKVKSSHESVTRHFVIEVNIPITLLLILLQNFKDLQITWELIYKSDDGKYYTENERERLKQDNNTFITDVWAKCVITSNNWVEFFKENCPKYTILTKGVNNEPIFLTYNSKKELKKGQNVQDSKSINGLTIEDFHDIDSTNQNNWCPIEVQKLSEWIYDLYHNIES